MRPLIISVCPNCGNDDPSGFTRMVREDHDGALEGVMCLVCGHERYVEDDGSEGRG